MRKFWTGFVTILLSMVATGAIADDRPTVTVFETAKIITMEPSLPEARFVAVADGTILGTADSLEELKPWTEGRRVNVDRRFATNILMPGLIDPHVHPMQSAVMLNMPFIAPDDWELPSGSYPGALTPEGYRGKLRAMLAKAPDGPFITWGHHQLFHGEIDRAELDEIAPDRPVIIWQRSFHEVIVNTAGLKLFGVAEENRFNELISSGKGDPGHASFEKGIFSETALSLAIAKLQPLLLAPAQLDKGFADMQRMMLKSGVTTVSDMGTGIFASFDVEAGLIKKAFARKDNPSRVMLMPIAGSVDAKLDLDPWYDSNRARYSSKHIRVDRRVKMFADGAFFAQNMRMNAPGYSDGHIGKWLTEPEALHGQFKRFWDAGFDLHIHVNGDEGLDAVLAGIEKLPVKNDQTVTLEHLGYSTEAQNRRIAKAGLMVSAQPNYIRVLGDAYAKEGLGADRASVMNRLGSLERKNVPIGLHSDFNMAPIDPLYLAWIASNRVTVGGNLKAPDEKLSLDKALRAITIEAAEVIGIDDMVGSIAAGKKADFAVLDRDPYDGGAAKLREVQIQGVIFEGEYHAAN